MIFKVLFYCIILNFFTPILANSSNIQWSYLDNTSCHLLSTSEETESISQLCSGFDKYQLKFDADDLRETLSVITPDSTNYPLELWHNINRDFSKISEIIAWHYLS